MAMNKKLMLLGVLALSALVISPAWKLPQDRKDIQAVLVKVVRDVSKKAPTTAWQQALSTDVLRSGHQVRTNEKSFAIINFSDQTKLVVREKSLVEIKGQVEGRQILDRNVHTTGGKISFDVKKQEKESFRFTSPISVASIRGTEGSYESNNEQQTDYLVISHGLATLTSVISDQSQDVGNNQTGIADGQGNLNVRQATPAELLLTKTIIPEDEESDSGSGGLGSQRTKKQVRILGEDANGNPRIVVIEWEE
jgi:hypothetical protein